MPINLFFFFENLTTPHPLLKNNEKDITLFLSVIPSKNLKKWKRSQIYTSFSFLID